MRELKFRAWDRINEEMVELHEIQPNLSVMFGAGANGGKYRRWNDVIVMQFTGLTDKNGKELYYDSDLVRLDIHPDRLWIATKDCFDIPCFLDANGAFGVMETFERVFLGGLHNRGDGFEIVGNKYQNPELLETKHQT